MHVENRGNNTYRLTISDGTDYQGNQARYRRTVRASTKKELKSLKAQFQNDYDNGLIGNANNLTVNGLCRLAIDEYLRVDLSESTIKGYEMILRRIEPSIGKKKLNKVTTKDIQTYINELARTESVNSIRHRKTHPSAEKEFYSTKTINSTYSFMHRCFEVGIMWDLISINPCHHIKLPKTHKKAAKALNIDSMPLFIKALPELDLDTRVLFELACFCGLRRSEILGLEIKHIEDGCIRIEQSRHYINHENIIKDPKTSQSKKTIAVPIFLQKDIAELIKEHNEKRLRIGSGYSNSSFLIHDLFGEPLKPDVCSRRLGRFLREHNIEPVTLHELRHTHATMLNYFGKDLVEISDQMRHAELTTTLNIYTHMFEDATQSSKNIAIDFDNYYKKVNGE